MNTKEMAALLDGRNYINEMSKDERAQAKLDGLVILTGYSDDGMRFLGAIDDHVDCFDGGTAYLTNQGLVKNCCSESECPYFQKVKSSAATIEAIWCGSDEFSWTYKTSIPHDTFEIFEDGEKYCKGIVFALHDVVSASAIAS